MRNEPSGKNGGDEPDAESEPLQIMSTISWADSVGSFLGAPAPSPCRPLTTSYDPCVDPVSIAAAIARHAELQRERLETERVAASIVAEMFDNVIKKAADAAGEKLPEPESTEPEAENMLQAETCCSFVQSSPQSTVLCSPGDISEVLDSAESATDQGVDDSDLKYELKPAVQRNNSERFGIPSLKALAWCCRS